MRIRGSRDRKGNLWLLYLYPIVWGVCVPPVLASPHGGSGVQPSRDCIVSHSPGSTIGLTATNQAIETRSTAIFDVFVQYGWDINQQSVGWLQRAVVWGGSVWWSFFWS